MRQLQVLFLKPRSAVVAGAWAVGLGLLAGCGGSSGGSTATPTSVSTGTATTIGTSSSSGGSVSCPTSAVVTAAIGVAYTGPKVDADGVGGPGYMTCQYASASDQVGVLVSFYPKGTSLRTLTANDSGSQMPLSGLGTSASYTTNADGANVYVYRASARGFSVIDQDDPAAKVEALARAIAG